MSHPLSCVRRHQNGCVGRFFEVWRQISDWLVSGLIVGCAAMCFVGAGQAAAIGGPVWIAVAMAAFGVALLAALVYFNRKRMKR